MDSKTKALLHKSGAVLASPNPGDVPATQFTVYPPAMSFTVSNNFFNHPNTDVEHVVSEIAVALGKAVAHEVEKQVLKAYNLDPKGAIKNIAEAKAKALANPFVTNAFGYTGDSLSPGVPLLSFDLDNSEANWSNVASGKADKWLGALMEKLATLGPGSPDLGGILTIPEGALWQVTDFEKWFDVPSHGADGTPPWVIGEWGVKSSGALDDQVGDLPSAKPNIYVEVYHKGIPGFATMRQGCPEEKEKCSFNKEWGAHGAVPFLQYTIIHLNDHHNWTRAAIADWLETLDHDLTFKTPEEVKDDSNAA